MITLVLRPWPLDKIGSKGLRYDVELDGKAIVIGSLEPAYDGARKLVELGHADGAFRTATPAGVTRMRFPSIHKAAKLTVLETRTGGIRTVPWKPFPPRAPSSQDALEEEEG